MARFTEQVAQSSVSLDTTGADAARQLASTLSAFSDRIGQERRQLVAKESMQQGIKAGLEKQSPVSGNTVAAEAFNQGLFQSYLAGVDNENRLAISELAEKYPDDPAKFSLMVEKYRSGALSALPEEMQTQAALNLDDQINRAAIQVQGNSIARQRNEILQDLQNNTNLNMDESGSLARMGDDAGSKIEFEKGLASIDAMDILASKKAEMKKAYKVEVTEQKYKGVNDRLYEEGGIKAVNGWLTKNEGKPRNGTSADEWDAITDAIQADANRKESRKNATKAASKTDIKNMLKQYETAKSLGWDVNRKDELQLISAISGFPDLVAKKKVIDKTATFSVMSSADRAAILDEANTGRLGDVEMRVSLGKANKQINKLAQEDGYSLGVNQGLIEAAPLELGNPESMAIRMDQVQGLEQHYGVPISPLMDSEAGALVESLPNMTPSEKVQLAMTFQDTPAVWGQLDKKNAGAFAMAGSTGDVQVMTDVFKGEELIANKLVKNLSPNDYLAEFEEMVEGIYGPHDRRALLDSVLKHYAATSANAVTGIYDAGDFENSLQAVSGGIAKINGFKIELPRGIDDDAFEDYVDNLQPDTIEALGGIANFTNEEAILAIQAGRIRNIGNNQYVIETGGGGFFTEKAVTTLFGRNGEPFIFSYNEDQAALNNAIAEEKAQQRADEIQAQIMER